MEKPLSPLELAQLAAPIFATKLIANANAPEGDSDDLATLTSDSVEYAIDLYYAACNKLNPGSE